MGMVFEGRFAGVRIVSSRVLSCGTSANEDGRGESYVAQVVALNCLLHPLPLGIKWCRWLWQWDQCRLVVRNQTPHCHVTAFFQGVNTAAFEQRSTLGPKDTAKQPVVCALIEGALTLAQ